MVISMGTAHNSASKGQIARTVLMPGDPLRAKFIADTFLEDVVCFNEVRNMLGYTGKYKGKEVSVMASGMGMPSIGIYSYELYKEYDVETIIRVGSAGSYCKEAKIYDVVLATESYSESSYAKVQSGYEHNKTYPSKELNERIKKTSNNLGIDIIEGCIHSSDVFYREGDGSYYKDLYKDMACVAVEMESFALFHNAAICGKKAACLLTISDSFVSGDATTPEERQKSFVKMIEIGLNAVE